MFNTWSMEVTRAGRDMVLRLFGDVEVVWRAITDGKCSEVVD